MKLKSFALIAGITVGNPDSVPPMRTAGLIVLTPQAASLDAMAALRAGAAGRGTTGAPAIRATGSASLATIQLAPIASLRADAIPLERRAGAVAIAARRIGAGRALQLGYEDSWRWRMGGGDGAVSEHRTWWTGLVSGVAYALRVPGATSAASTDQAPMSNLVCAIGPSTSAARMLSLSTRPTDWIAWLFGLLALGLIGEVASRRLRGAA